MAGAVRLRIIGTTDLHANIFAYDYYRDRPDDTVGLARDRLADRGRARRSGEALLFDNGDIIQGTPLGDYAAERLAKDRGDDPSDDRGDERIGYDAGAIGNHEFNYGLDVLDARARRRQLSRPQLQHSCGPTARSISSRGSCSSATLRDEAARAQRLQSA